MIMTALNSAPEGKMTLGDIYEWILKQYPYFKTAGTSWKVLTSTHCVIAFIDRTLSDTIFHSVACSRKFHDVPRIQAKERSGQSIVSTLHRELSNRKRIHERRNAVVHPMNRWTISNTIDFNRLQLQCLHTKVVTRLRFRCPMLERSQI
jgi:hypothetical protein